jgi:CarD family transcriptional regulator
MHLEAGCQVVHSLHGVGTVESLETKELLGKLTRFATIAFQDDRLKIMVNLDQRNSMLRPLMTGSQVEQILEHMRGHCNDAVVTKSTHRYNLNLQKIKSGDVSSLCEVIKELSGLLEEKRLTQKEHSMLEQSRKILASELSQVKQRPHEEMIELICQTCGLNVELAKV